jgi:excisionase family DNA binding protein
MRDNRENATSESQIVDDVGGMHVDVEQLYDRWFAKTGSPEAAATMVLAHVHARRTTLPSPMSDTPSGPLPASNGVMSVKQAAEQLGVSRETVYKLCGEGTLPHTRIRNRITITLAQLGQYQREQER